MESKDSRNLISCGILGAPFGIAGAFHCYPSSGQIDHLLKQKSFFMKEKDTYHLVEVHSLRKHDDHLVIAFSSITSRELAKLKVHQHIYIDPCNLPPLAPKEYYWHQLEGLEVISLQEEALGLVERLYHNGAQDVLVTARGDHIPFVTDQTIKKVDLEAKIITVDFDPIYLQE